MDIVERLRLRSERVVKEDRWGKVVSVDKEALEAADEIERLRKENERLGREVNIAKYGAPNFAWSVHQAAMYDLRAEIERLREALNEIANHRYDAGGAWEMCKIARAALKEPE